jgi:hypothetical protein
MPVVPENIPSACPRFEKLIFKNFEVTVFAEKVDSNACSVPADKKISRGISEPQIFDANFIQIQRQAGVRKANLPLSSPHLESETGA